jgi:hypothetical protein
LSISERYELRQGRTVNFVVVRLCLYCDELIICVGALVEPKTVFQWLGV